MTTKAPATVKESPADSLENVAYKAVEQIATTEPNDRNRLGYHLWRWLSNRQGTLEQVILESGARIVMTPEAAANIIHDALEKSGKLPA